jgi:hypothetical protein
MPSVFATPNLKAQREILVINAPASFAAEVAALKGVVVLRYPKKTTTVHFCPGVCSHAGRT